MIESMNENMRAIIYQRFNPFFFRKKSFSCVRERQCIKSQNNQVLMQPRS